MSTRLTTYLEFHEIIYPKQFGFKAGFSTTHSLISITETIKKTLDEKKYGCGVFIDLKKLLIPLIITYSCKNLTIMEFVELHYHGLNLT